jgi:hypothetical protein
MIKGTPPSFPFIIAEGFTASTIWENRKWWNLQIPCLWTQIFHITQKEVCAFENTNLSPKFTLSALSWMFHTSITRQRFKQFRTWVLLTCHLSVSGLSNTLCYPWWNHSCNMSQMIINHKILTNLSPGSWRVPRRYLEAREHTQMTRNRNHNW